MASPAPTAAAVKAALAALATPEKAKVMAGFFKTGKGQYGEGDRFIGVTVPAQRKVARAHQGMSLPEVQKLLRSPVHEDRLTGVFILVRRYEKGDAAEKKEAFDFYLANLAGVNNWDLVDSSASQIVGAHLLKSDRALLHRLAKSRLLWERRVAMVSTQAFHRAGEWKDTFALAEALMSDEHDLMHKAMGWMLREVAEHVGADTLRGFLKKHSGHMPRTALRYAIEHFSKAERKQWLTRDVATPPP